MGATQVVTSRVGQCLQNQADIMVQTPSSGPNSQMTGLPFASLKGLGARPGLGWASAGVGPLHVELENRFSIPKQAG